MLEVGSKSDQKTFASGEGESARPSRIFKQPVKHQVSTAVTRLVRGVGLIVQENNDGNLAMTHGAMKTGAFARVAMLFVEVSRGIEEKLRILKTMQCDSKVGFHLRL